MHVRSNRFRGVGRPTRRALATVVATLALAIVADQTFARTACAQQAGWLRRPALRDARGWMPDIAERLEQLTSDRKAAVATPQRATSTNRDEPPWWWLPCPPPDEAKP